MMSADVLAASTLRSAADPDQARSAPAVTASLVNEHARLSAGPFNWDADLPAAIDGENLAPSPTAYLLGALAGCAVAFIHDTLAPQLGLRLDDVSAVARCTADARGLLGMEDAVPDLAFREQGEEAGPLLAEALRIYTELSDPRGVAQCLEALACVASERAHYESAARLIGAAAVWRERAAARQPDTERARSSAAQRILARALGPQDADSLIHAGRTMPVKQAADLAMAVASGAAPGDPDHPQPVRLTPRERQVAALVASGRTNRQIGRVLGISEKTAEVHLHHVMSKLDARSRAEVAAWAVTHHLSAPV
jgi:DNA-binding NarL/FixJ family response regulator